MAQNNARNDPIKGRTRAVPSRTFTTQLEEGRFEEALGDIGLPAIATARVFDQNRSISRRRPTTGPPEDEGIREVHETRDFNLRAIEKRIAALEIALDTVLAQNGSQNHRIAVGATVTPWRMLSTVITVALGAYKAIATYSGQTLGPATMDWIIGIVWTLIVYWVSFFDDPTSSDSSWFFTLDISTPPGPWILLVLLCAGAYALYRYASDAAQLWIGLGFGFAVTIVAACSENKPAAKLRRRQESHDQAY
ncbi:hypothetical protein C8R47DRAFT_403105 [Mycena vitilis]|nr:hypothetical protein C8R47DRAFT_403105 [Mycena vitilis]